MDVFSIFIIKEHPENGATWCFSFYPFLNYRGGLDNIHAWRLVPRSISPGDVSKAHVLVLSLQTTVCVSARSLFWMKSVTPQHPE